MNETRNHLKFVPSRSKKKKKKKSIENIDL